MHETEFEAETLTDVEDSLILKGVTDTFWSPVSATVKG